MPSNATTTGDKPRSAFFYGTLMAPQVLHRVCHGSMSPDNPIYTQSTLTAHPAILHNHRRHRVKHADYPAILPVLASSTSQSTPAPTVRGTYVTNLTDADIWRLDIFEGDEYERRVVKARLLDVIGDDVDGKGNVEGEEVEAETYVWIAGKEWLEAEEWDFEEFRREKMAAWVGGGEGGEREDILEVDEAVAAKERAEAGQMQGQRDGTGGRGLNGHISSVLANEHKKNEAIRNAV